MARVCQITGKKTSAGNSRSHACNARKRTFRPNLFVKRVLDPKTGRMKRMKISASALRTLTKNAR